MRAPALLVLPIVLSTVAACNPAGPAPVAVTRPVAATAAPAPSATEEVYVAQAVDGLPASHAPATQVQGQPPAGSCHVRGSGAPLPDPRCTPGALDPAVTQATIGSTICVAGYTRTVRPPSSVTAPEKRASMQAYGDTGPARAYEYDHLVSLELGGAANDPRNLWPEPGGSPNPKDRLENRLHALVCGGTLPLREAQDEIATDWAAAYRSVFGTAPGTAAAPAPAPPAPAPAAAPAGAGCTASVSDPQPGRGGSETVTVRTTAGAAVRTVAHYRTTDSEHDGTAGSSGAATVTFSIGRPTAGYTVSVTVTTSSGQSCATAFTPQ
ncbi:MAG: hypothetical protein ACXVFU_11735 [Nocardioidaceae bacterium]